MSQCGQRQCTSKRPSAATDRSHVNCLSRCWRECFFVLFMCPPAVHNNNLSVLKVPCNTVTPINQPPAVAIVTCLRFVWKARRQSIGHDSLQAVAHLPALLWQRASHLVNKQCSQLGGTRVIVTYTYCYIPRVPTSNASEIDIFSGIVVIW